MSYVFFLFLLSSFHFHLLEDLIFPDFYYIAMSLRQSDKAVNFLRDFPTLAMLFACVPLTEFVSLCDILGVMKMSQGRGIRVFKK